jgi:hypothetical protein
MAATSSPAALILELDPDLGAGVSPEEWEAARDAVRGHFLRVPRGRWPIFSSAAGADDIVGLLIAEGLLCREVGLRDRSMLELLGPGDVLQPPVRTGRPRLGGDVELTGLSDVLLAVLGDSFVRAAARWPSLLATVQRRLEIQRQYLAVQGLIAHLPLADHRLLLILYHMAERFGHVTAEGIVLPLALTHSLLGQLIGARRPTATLALRGLQSERLVRRLDDGSWLLTAAAERKINVITRSSGRNVLGERLTLCRWIGKTRADRSSKR